MNKRKLYESIMKDVSKVVKKYLNEEQELLTVKNVASFLYSKLENMTYLSNDTDEFIDGIKWFQDECRGDFERMYNTNDNTGDAIRKTQRLFKETADYFNCSYQEIKEYLFDNSNEIDNIFFKLYNGYY